MVDTKLIRIHIDFKDVTDQIAQVEEKAKKTVSFIQDVKDRFNVYQRTTFRILGSIVRLTGAITDISLITSILAGIQTQATVRRIGIRAGVEYAAGNLPLAGLLVLQAGLLEMEFFANLANQNAMREHIDRINTIAEMTG